MKKKEPCTKSKCPLVYVQSDTNENLQFRCSKCRKLLARYDQFVDVVESKCVRCGEINQIESWHSSFSMIIDRQGFISHIDAKDVQIGELNMQHILGQKAHVVFSALKFPDVDISSLFESKEKEMSPFFHACDTEDNGGEVYRFARCTFLYDVDGNATLMLCTLTTVNSVSKTVS